MFSHVLPMRSPWTDKPWTGCCAVGRLSLIRHPECSKQTCLLSGRRRRAWGEERGPFV